MARSQFRRARQILGQGTALTFKTIVQAAGVKLTHGANTVVTFSNAVDRIIINFASDASGIFFGWRAEDTSGAACVASPSTAGASAVGAEGQGCFVGAVKGGTVILEVSNPAQIWHFWNNDGATDVSVMIEGGMAAQANE